MFPELSAEEIQARVLHRDGLMLVIDKPAGLPGASRPQGRRQPRNFIRRVAIRPAATAGSGASARPRYVRLPRPRPPSQGHRLARIAVQAWQGFQDLLGRGRGRTGRGRRRHRHAARPAQRRARLVAEARSGRPTGGYQMESARTRLLLRSRLRGGGEQHRRRPCRTPTQPSPQGGRKKPSAN